MPPAWTRSTSRRPAPTGFYATMYYGHNLQFESAAAMFAGNLAQARAAAQRTVKLADPIADQMVMIEPFAAQELTVLVRFGQWQTILETKPPAPTRAVAERAVSLRARRGARRDRQGRGGRSRSCGAEGGGREAPEGRDGRLLEHGRRRHCRGDRRPDRAHRRCERRYRRRHQGLHRRRGPRGQARLQRTARLAESPSASVSARSCSRRAGTPRPRRCSAPISRRTSAIRDRSIGLYRALEGQKKPAAAEVEGVVRQGVGGRRRDAWRRSLRLASLIVEKEPATFLRVT